MSSAARQEIRLEAGGALAPPLERSHGVTRTEVARTLPRLAKVVPDLLGRDAASGFLRVLGRSKLLKGLLDRDPPKRLGSGPTDGAEIRAHPFFASINWSDLYDIEGEKEIAKLRRRNLLREFSDYSEAELWDAIQQKNAESEEEGDDDDTDVADLKTPEWDVFINPDHAQQIGRAHV